MIKNFVFDLGKVLVEFDPLVYLKVLGFSGNMKDKLNEIIFNSNEWAEYDRGIYLHNFDIAKAISNNYPEYKKEIDIVLKDDWVKIHQVKKDVAMYLKELKEQGMKIYILSNISKDSFDYVSRFDFFKYIDGGVYSYNVNICKPNEGIYRILLEKYNLIPKETVFFDDRPDNIETARKLGIYGIQFDTLEDAKKKLKEI